MTTEITEITEQGETDVTEESLVAEDTIDVEVEEVDDHAVAAAENEGFPPAPTHVSLYGFQIKQEPVEDEDTVAVKQALANLYDIQDKLTAAISDHAAKSRTAKNAKEYVEALQEHFYSAVTYLRDCNKPLPLFARKPDPAKEAINAEFPSPVAIQPLPAADIDEFFRRKRRDTRLDSLGLTASVDAILAAAGYVTILDLDKIFEGGADLCTIKVSGTGSITEKRQESILNAIAELAVKWKAEWDAEHSEDADDVAEAERIVAEGGEAVPYEQVREELGLSDGDTDEFEPLDIQRYTRCNTCGWSKPQGSADPCPRGHATGFTSDPVDEDDDDGDEPE